MRHIIGSFIVSEFIFWDIGLPFTKGKGLGSGKGDGFKEGWKGTKRFGKHSF